MSEIKLLPCPFCGGEAGTHEDYHNYWLVQCSKCGCGTLHRYSKEDAIKDWNTRKPMQEIVERLEEKKNSFHGGTLQENYYWRGVEEAIEIVKEVGGIDV